MIGHNTIKTMFRVSMLLAEIQWLIMFENYLDGLNFNHILRGPR